jgi:hypothetical protein
MVELEGHTLRGEKVQRTIPVCGPATFAVLKALAVADRAERKMRTTLYMCCAAGRHTTPTSLSEWPGMPRSLRTSSGAPLKPYNAIEPAIFALRLTLRGGPGRTRTYDVRIMRIIDP